MITKKELLQMLSDTESYNIERTESTGAENGGYPPTQNGDIRSLF